MRQKRLKYCLYLRYYCKNYKQLMINSNLKEVKISIKEVELKATFFNSLNSSRLVIFAHGSGSSRLSPRNIFVAESLMAHGISSFLFDLLTEDEDQIYQNRFEIDMITSRLIEVTKWLKNQSFTKGLVFGYFGSQSVTPSYP